MILVMVMERKEGVREETGNGEKDFVEHAIQLCLFYGENDTDNAFKVQHLRSKKKEEMCSLSVLEKDLSLISHILLVLYDFKTTSHTDN